MRLRDSWRNLDQPSFLLDGRPFRPKSKRNRHSWKSHLRRKIIRDTQRRGNNKHIKLILIHSPQDPTLTPKIQFLLHHLPVLFTINIDSFRLGPEKLSDVTFRVLLFWFG